MSHSHSVEWHWHRANEHIRHRQRSHEEVGGLPDLPVHHEWHQHQEVPERGDDDAAGQGDSDEDGEEGPKGGWPAFGAAGNGVGAWGRGLHIAFSS